MQSQPRLDLKLGRYFTLSELCQSDVAVRLGIDNQPDEDAVKGLAQLCSGILNPLREALDRPIFVHSGYRSTALNKVVGGSPKSDHVFGRAADIICQGLSPLELCQAVENIGFPFKQLIYEFGSEGWCHISIGPAGSVPKREVLRAVKRNGKTIYLKGLKDLL